LDELADGLEAGQAGDLVGEAAGEPALGFDLHP